MIRLRQLALAAAVLLYALAWTPIATVAALVHEAPRSWVAWLVIVANPITLAVCAGLFTRYHRERVRHG